MTRFILRKLLPASTTRIDPGTTIFSNSGLVLKRTLDYPNRGVSGYWIAYNKCRTNNSGTCTGDAADPPGQSRPLEAEQL